MLRVLEAWRISYQRSAERIYLDIDDNFVYCVT